MPYIPREARRYAPTTSKGSAPELAYADKPTIPVRTPTPENRQRQEARMGVGTISPHSYSISPERIFKQLFGKELEVDEHSGICNLVPNARGAASLAG